MGRRHPIDPEPPSPRGRDVAAATSVWVIGAGRSYWGDREEERMDLVASEDEYRPGDTATLRFVPRTAGKALVTVVSNRLIDRIEVDAVAGENTVTLPVTDEWGAGAYVTATLIQPLDAATGHDPTRALGLAHASVDPGASAGSP